VRDRKNDIEPSPTRESAHGLCREGRNLMECERDERDRERPNRKGRLGRNRMVRLRHVMYGTVGKSYLNLGARGHPWESVLVRVRVRVTEWFVCEIPCMAKSNRETP